MYATNINHYITESIKQKRKGPLGIFLFFACNCKYKEHHLHTPPPKKEEKEEKRRHKVTSHE